MSKRFGRNQRRKLREQLAEQVSIARSHARTAGKLASDLRTCERLNDGLEKQLDALKRVLGPHHPVFPASKLDPGFRPEPEYPLRVVSRDGEPLDATVMRFGRPQSNEFKRSVHYRLYAGNESFGYAITEHALRTVPRDVLAWSMTNELVKLLLDTMRKEPRR